MVFQNQPIRLFLVRVAVVPTTDSAAQPSEMYLATSAPRIACCWSVLIGMDTRALLRWVCTG